MNKTSRSTSSKSASLIFDVSFADKKSRFRTKTLMNCSPCLLVNVEIVRLSSSRVSVDIDGAKSYAIRQLDLFQVHARHFLAMDFVFHRTEDSV